MWNIDPTLQIGIIIGISFLFGELVSLIKLPKITGYIIAGILMNPQLFGKLSKDLSSHANFITNVSLSFITFSIGGSLLYSKIKSLGKGIVYITICEAQFAFIATALGFLAVLPLLLHGAHNTWATTFIPISLVLAALASPTDPTAALAVIHESKAKGNVTTTMLSVAAFDDALGLINYCLVLSIAAMLIKHAEFSFYNSILIPLYQIGSSALLGCAFGFFFNWVTKLMKKETDGALIVVILSLLLLCFGVAHLVGADELLSTMIMGIIVVNFNIKHEKIFTMLERYTEELIFVFFFTLSGMFLDFHVFTKALPFIILFAIFRTIGKFGGTAIGAIIAKSEPAVKKYTAGGLIPSGGIIVGMALMLRQKPDFSHIADMIISVIIGATVLHELLGPVLARISLKKAGEIK